MIDDFDWQLVYFVSAKMIQSHFYNVDATEIKAIMQNMLLLLLEFFQQPRNHIFMALTEKNRTR